MPALVSRSGGRGRRTINEINMVPFIDVMLVLLIIFMVTAPLITPGMVELPSIGRAPRQPDRVIEVILSRDETIEWRQVSGGNAPGSASAQRSTLARLAQDIRKAQGDDTQTAVVISADRNLKYEAVVRVMDSLQKGGVQRVGLSMQLTAGGAKP